jgi:membrane-bound ClpP family serine protease
MLLFVSKFYMTSPFGSHVVLWSSLLLALQHLEQLPIRFTAIAIASASLILLVLAIASRDAFGFLTISSLSCGPRKGCEYR